jgi:uncharacterized protein YceH (UPF0502 family)
MSLEDRDVARAVEDLRLKHLVCEVYVAGSRVPKYEHKITEEFNLTRPGLALLCVLLLRGPQTPGELRARTGRMHDFQDLQEVEAGLRSLEDSSAGPLAVQLERLPGRKEARFAHLLCGEPRIDESPPGLSPEPAVVEIRAERERLDTLEKTVRSLGEQLAELTVKFEEFKGQFE